MHRKPVPVQEDKDRGCVLNDGNDRNKEKRGDCQPGGLRQTVPPGTYAEYGYLLGMEGKHEEAIKMFEREMALYPESAPFMRYMIKRLEP